MADKQMTTYTLWFKHGMSYATGQRLQADMPVSTHTKMTALLSECRAVFVFYKDSKDFSLAPGDYEEVRASS